MRKIARRIAEVLAEEYADSGEGTEVHRFDFWKKSVKITVETVERVNAEESICQTVPV